MTQNEKLSIEWDIEFLRNQIQMCEDGINSGNWEGYSEALAVRKQRLKELKKELEEKLVKHVFI
jgi:hypothetical protein